MKTWIYWYDQLPLLCKKLDPNFQGVSLKSAPSYKSTAYLKFCQDSFQKNNEKTNEAIRQFSETETFPDVSTDVIFCIQERVRQAHDFLYPLMIPKRGYTKKTFIPSPDRGTSHSEIWRWLLIDLWESWGESEYLRNLEKEIRSGWDETGSLL